MPIYIIAGCAGVFLLIWLGKKLSKADEKTYRLIIKLAVILLLLVVAFIIFRTGQPIIAAILGAAGILLPYTVKLLRIYGMARWVGRFFRKKKANISQKTSSSQMTRKQALEILGLKEGATAKEIKERYQHLMKQVHPDKGGSAHFSQQLNDAKETLLKL